MNVTGTVWLPVKIGCMNKGKLIEFSVVNRNYSCVLLDRNVMKLHENVTFDYINGKIKLGNVWVNRMKIN